MRLPSGVNHHVQHWVTSLTERFVTEVTFGTGHFRTRALHHVLLQIPRLCEGFATLVTTVWLLTSALLSGVHPLVFIKISRVSEGNAPLVTTVSLMTSVSHMGLIRQRGCVEDV